MSLSTAASLLDPAKPTVVLVSRPGVVARVIVEAARATAG
jgi:hypothetical protein